MVMEITSYVLYLHDFDNFCIFLGNCHKTCIINKSEFKTLLCQVRIVINNQSGKIIGFTDFSNWYNSRMRGCLVGFLLFFSHLEFKKNCGFFLLVSGEK